MAGLNISATQLIILHTPAAYRVWVRIVVCMSVTNPISASCKFACTACRQMKLCLILFVHVSLWNLFPRWMTQLYVIQIWIGLLEGNRQVNRSVIYAGDWFAGLKPDQNGRQQTWCTSGETFKKKFHNEFELITYFGSYILPNVYSNAIFQ